MPLPSNIDCGLRPADRSVGIRPRNPIVHMPATGPHGETPLPVTTAWNHGKQATSGQEVGDATMDTEHMAGLSGSTQNGWRITFRLDNQPRQFRFRGSKTNANAIRLHIENIIEARGSSGQLVASTAAWLDDIEDKLYEKLRRAGLVHPRARTVPTTLGDLTLEFVDQSDVKPGTLQVYRQAIRSLHEHFGEQKPLDEITPFDAAKWRSGLANSTLSPATQSKRVNTAKAIFNRAVDWELIASSPFQKIKSGSQANPDRQRYVEASVIHDVLNFCPDDEWRCVICLARFAGLRCPSEISRLTWELIDLQSLRMTVLSPKTEHHQGKGRRIVPIVPALLPVLTRLHQDRDSDSRFVVPRLAGRSNANLRTQFLKFIQTSGHQKWPRLFQNLRASAEMDWLEVSQAYAVAAWMGHSPQVALRHYTKVRDRDIDEATDPKVWERAMKNRRGGSGTEAAGGD